MRLIRNTSDDGRCKYALIDNRTGEKLEASAGHPEEFFVLKLKDEFSEPALRAYANAARDWDPEFASDVDEMADRAGKNHPLCKRPD